jgi:hypothetical protein
MDDMREALDNLSREVVNYGKQLVTLVESDNDYRELYAKTYLEVKASADKMTVGEIDAKVTDRVKDTKRKADIAEALMKATREKMDLDRKRIEVDQSVLSFSRAELEHTPNQEPNMVREKAWQT